MKIAICDDEKQLRSILRQKIAANSGDIKITEFSDGSELISSKERFDIIFLDPHFVQENINLNDVLNLNFKSFETEKFYFINAENISPSFTLGFSFENIDDFIDFIEKSNCLKIKENSDEKKFYLNFNFDNFINFKYDKNLNNENIIKLTLIK